MLSVDKHPLLGARAQGNIELSGMIQCNSGYGDADSTVAINNYLSKAGVVVKAGIARFTL
jgi:hypothetical protein